MTAFQRTWIALLSMVLVASIVHPCNAKPTREQIVALAETCKNGKTRMDLVEAFGTDFSGLDISGVDFRGYHAKGFETNLRKANFSNCNLRAAEFGAAILDDADFTGANLEKATFVTASLRQATLLHASLKGARFYQTDLSGAKLTGADLSSADITGSKFGGAELSGAILAGAKNEYWWNEFGNANLTRANLSGLKLNGAGFQGAVLRSANLSGTQLIEADFTGADLTEVSFDDANVESAIFQDVQGLNDAQRDQLERRAQRWKFEFMTGIAGFRKRMYFPAYAFVLVALLGLSFRVLPAPNRPRSVAVAAVVNVLIFLPACLLFYMRALGMSSTVQFNVGSRAAMQLWSAWVGLWPLFMLAILICLIVAVGTGVVFLATHWRWTTLKQSKLVLVYIGLTVVHCLFAAHWVGSNFPDA